MTPVAKAARREREHQQTAASVLPKTTDMSALAQADLDFAAHQLNGPPRQAVGWMTPASKLAEALQ